MPMTSAQAETFKTSDYGQAGFLIAKGLRYGKVERDGDQVFFHFSVSSELLAALGEYGSNGPVPCRDFFHGLRRARGVIRETLNGRQR